ncbi:hypothetical protein BvCms6BK_04574 [Escherichia coli]|nr:hypothetical protein BvCms6BK_04574 [Escherichia coli]GDR22231.1 hypothetical protein BvCmsOUNP033_04769 [Escherichia coli]SQS20692.1 Uncharacterised protein [Escherichia coli]STL33328.1 Uncharacterised protein [Escherichia coli]
MKFRIYKVNDSLQLIRKITAELNYEERNT